MLATERNTMSTRNSTKGKSGPQPKIKVKIPLSIPNPPMEEIKKDPMIAEHTEQLKQIVELLDEIRRKANDANNAVVGLVRVITAFHL